MTTLFSVLLKNSACPKNTILTAAPPVTSQANSYDMKYYSMITALLLLVHGKPVMAQTGSSFNQLLADSLNNMKVVDQIAMKPPVDKYKELTQGAWQQFKDSVVGTHKGILENIFSRYGYPGYDLVGKEGEHSFWLMVQHCDPWPGFQEKVLTAMKPQVAKGNANPSNYAYLTDRVLINTGRKQLYGTQITYNLDSCQALPKPLQDSLSVNTRRKEMGMPPVETYLNDASTFHFEMNRAMYEKKGITKPKLYDVKQQ